MKPSGKDAAALRKEKAALRKKTEAVLKLDRQGGHEEALARVDELAAKHGESALVLHLAGHLHHAAARRTAKAAVDLRGKKTTKDHIVTALDHLAKAKRLVPNCIAISDLLAWVLFLGGKPVEAEKEAREAVSIASPVDPADNSVLFDLPSNSTRDQRVQFCMKLARANLSTFERRIPDLVREVLKLDADGHDADGARDAANKAANKANALAKQYPSSSRVQLLRAQMQVQRVRHFDPDMDRRPFLDHIRKAMEETTVANSFGASLLLAVFHAKLCFVLGLYETVYFECVRAFAIPEPVDPKSEDVPPYSVQGDKFEDRALSVYEELSCLVGKLFFVADDFRCSMTSEKQHGFLSVRLLDLQGYYDKHFENYGWAVQTTISDALSFVKNNMSWRFWICPICDGNEFLDPDSLLEHMNSKHLPKLRSVFDSEHNEYVIVDDCLDQIAVYQDSEGHHFLRFNKADYVFRHLSVPTEEIAFAKLQEEVCERGKEILEEIKDKLKCLPEEQFRAEFDKARLEIQDMWFHFVKISMLDYRLVIMTLARPFIWTKLLRSLSEDKAAPKISNDDIDVIFPRGEVHAEDKVGGSEIHQNSNIADVQSGVTGLKYRPSIAKGSASNLLGSCSQSSEQTTSISIYQKSTEALDKETDNIFALNFIIQMLWNLRCFRDEFLKSRPVCTLPRHEGPCISQMLYAIFTAWEKDDHHITDSLISIRDTICQVSNDSTVVQNVEVNTSSYIVTNILNGLKMPEVFLEVHLGNFSRHTKVFETLRQAANPAKELCNKEIICGGFAIKESTTCGNTIDMDSLQIAEVKSFADDKCRQVDQLHVSMPEFSTLAVHIVLSDGGNQRTFLKEILDYPDLVLFRIQHTTTDTIKCTFVSMIFYHEGKLLSIVREHNKWLVFVYNDAVAAEFNSLKELLDRYDLYADEMHPEVCFFDNVKIVN